MPVRGVGDDDDGWETVEDSHIQPVSGGGAESVEIKDIIDIDSDEVIQPAVPLPAPIAPSQKEVDAHNLFHLPYRPWCKHCVAARRKNSHHRSVPSASHRTVPLMVADYAYIRDHQDKALATVLVVRVKP